LIPKNLARIWGKEKKWQCEICGRKWKDGFLLEFHHRRPTSAGGTDELENIELLCIFHHWIAHIELERRNVGHKSANIVGARFKRTHGKWK